MHKVVVFYYPWPWFSSKPHNKFPKPHIMFVNVNHTAQMIENNFGENVKIACINKVILVFKSKSFVQAK